MIPTYKPRLPFNITTKSANNLNSNLLVPNKPVEPPSEAALPRVVQFGADLSGCGLYRLGWVSHLMNYQGMAMITDTNVMVLDPRWYVNVKAIRLQRQATSHQKEFVKFLKEVQKEHKFKLIYEIDDVVFREDIPDYNKFKSAFTSDEIRQNVKDIIDLCDEVSVTCQYMKDLYKERTGKNEITIIPNFPAKFWIGNYFNPDRINHLYDKNKKKPRILYTGSGAHFDVENRVNQKDDFEHVVKSIIDSRHKYQWVFIGAYPIALHPYVQKGEIEFHQWQRLYDYPQKIYNLGVQMTVAPLQVNSFNMSKSDIKYIEACAFGLPVACQDMCTYEDAEIKFKTGDEMLYKIEEELRRTGHYKNSSYKRRKVAEERFLENGDNLNCYSELFFTPYGSKDRKSLSKFNK